MLTKGVPAYRRIQSAIRRIIEAGELKPGDVVASERELARLHNVSLMTARHALVSLEREGIVERRRSVGTFVAAPKIHFNKLMSYTEQMGSRRLTPVSKILFAKIIENDEEVDATVADPRTADLLQVPKPEPLLRIRQVIYSTKGIVILYVLGLYRSDRHNLIIRRYR